ncbi:methyltransferase domain-containing protein [Roseomonas sp. SSH11]|uniref:Methyltransferase domain-containing protein n=1 Tax=Pararoseomonas baculiformis TaxID=2820812 RepID=A0ABS4ACR4_9PROT|nr:methyltransferase domain-containing protein [Pararoseomonas baculiformis]MBP0444809.1 methyltransferase domain-containing protein [Pararoseomonas baculiformis]
MDQTQLQAPDVYGRTFQMDEQTLGVIATRLEARGRHPFFLRVIDEYMGELSLTAGESVLDIGCGTGVAARAIARRPDMHGPITAIDISEHLVKAGRRLAEEEGLGDRIDFRVGDAHGLGLPEGGFDVVVMHTLISHVADPAAVLAEGKRLLRPGTGRMVVFDGDYASLTLATDAADGGEATDRAVQRGIIAQPRVMRAMPRLLAEAGLGLLWSRAYVVADIGRADYCAPMITSFRVLLPKVGVMTEAEANSFADGLERASAENRFFGASNFYTYLAGRSA